MIFKAKECENSAIHYIGNGKMMICGNGADLWSIQGQAYSSPCFGSLSVCDVCESESTRISHSLFYRHDIYLSDSFMRMSDGDIPEAVIDDCIHPERQIFVRSVRSAAKLQMRLLTPAYVRKYIYRSYRLRADMTADLYVYIIPAGSCYYESLYCQKEIRMLIMTLGDVESDGEYFHFKDGQSHMIITTGSAKECLEDVKYAALCMKKGTWQNNDIYNCSKEHWANLTKNCEGASEDCLVSLLARQSCDGGIMAAHSLPMSDINCFYYAVRAFSALSLENNLKNLVDYYRKAFEISGPEVHTYYGLNTKDFIPDVNQGRSAAALLKGFVAYFEDHALESGDEMLLKELYYLLIRSIGEGVAPFCGREAELEAGIIPLYLGIWESGSCRASAEAIDACRDYIGLVRKKGLKVRSDFANTVSKIERFAKDFQDNFTNENAITANRLLLKGSLKRRRFIYSRCPICQRNGRYAPLTWLEKHPIKGCVCCYCMTSADKQEILPPAERVFLLSSVCVALLCGLLTSEMQEQMLDLVCKQAQQYVLDTAELGMRSSDHDILVLMVLEKYGFPTKSYREKLDYNASCLSCFSTYLCGAEHVGRSGESFPTAMYLWSRLSSKDLNV